MNKFYFKDLAFVSILIIIIIFLVQTYLDERNVKILSHGPSDIYLSFVAVITLFLGIISTIISVIKKEPKDFRYKFIVWGYPFLIVFLIIGTIATLRL